MDWVSASRHFVMIVETGSFAEAARKRYTSSSALSKQINWLEDHLNTKLLHRTTRHLTVTDSGQAFYVKAKQILEKIDCLQAEVQEETPCLRGTLRISCQVLGQQSFLLQLIPIFLAQHPRLRIELLVNPKQQDLAAEGVDLAIRAGLTHNSKLVQEKLGSLMEYVYGTQDYFDKHGVPQTPQDLMQHNCLSHSDLDKKWNFRDDTHVSVSGSFMANSTAALIEAATNHLGLIQVSDALIEKYVLDKTLIPVLQKYANPCVGVYAVYQQQTYQNKSLQALLAFLKEHKFSSLFCREEISA